jgi:hypothetical protein
MRIYKILVFELLGMVLPAHIAIADANGEQTRPGRPGMLCTINLTGSQVANQQLVPTKVIERQKSSSGCSSGCLEYGNAAISDVKKLIYDK